MPVGEHDLAKLSTCTTCQFKEDFSNYWTAVLYFKAKNGSFHRVPQMPNKGFNDEPVGGVTVYYIPPYDGKTNVTAFKPVSLPRLDPGKKPLKLIYTRVSACW